jgi:hypothetical protein
MAALEGGLLAEGGDELTEEVIIESLASGQMYEDPAFPGDDSYLYKVRVSFNA